MQKQEIVKHVETIVQQMIDELQRHKDFDVTFDTIDNNPNLLMSGEIDLTYSNFSEEWGEDETLENMDIDLEIIHIDDDGVVLTNFFIDENDLNL